MLLPKRSISFLFAAGSLKNVEICERVILSFLLPFCQAHKQESTIDLSSMQQEVLWSVDSVEKSYQMMPLLVLKGYHLQKQQQGNWEIELLDAVDWLKKPICYTL